MITKSKKIDKLIYKYEPTENLIVVFSATKRFKYVLTPETDFLFAVVGTPDLRFKDFAENPTIPDTVIKLMNFTHRYDNFGEVPNV